MVLGGGGAQGGDHVGDAVLMQGDHVHVAFHHIEAFAAVAALAPLPQPVELFALMEYRGFRAVQVFGLAVAQQAAPKADGAATGIADGENDPVAELVVNPARVLPAHQQAGSKRLFQASFGE